MSIVFGAEGFKALRTSWALLAVALVLAAGIGFGSQWFVERVQRDNAASARKLQEARSRLDNARRERDNLAQSAEVFRTLVDRGMLQGERRLDMVERVAQLRERFRLHGLDYEIAPQRPLVLAGGRAYPSVEVLSSRVKLRIRALHEGDVLGFLEALTEATQGFYPIDRCAMRRIDTGGTGGAQADLEAECSLEWITLKEKRGPRPA